MTPIDSEQEPVDDNICPDTGERHDPDWGSVSLEFDGGAVYVDIVCRQCGRSGCVGKVDAVSEDIQW